MPGESAQASHLRDEVFDAVLATEGLSSLTLLLIGPNTAEAEPSYFFDIRLGNAEAAELWGVAIDDAYLRVLWRHRQDRRAPSRVEQRGDCSERSYQAFRRWQLLLRRVREVNRRCRKARV